MSLAARFAQCFPVVVGDSSVDVIAIDASDDRVMLTAQMVTTEDGAVVDLREQQLVVERGAPRARPDRVPVAPSEIEPAALAENVRHHLGWARFPMPRELFEPPAPFVPVGPFPDDELRIEHVGYAVAEQGWAHGFEMRYWVVDQWPDEARTVYFLQSLYAMAGGNGLEVFLHQNDPLEVMAVLDALTHASCERLARRYREALGLAAEEGAEPLLYVDEDWLDEQRLPPPSTDRPNRWHAIDSHDEGGTYWLIDHELRPSAAAFLVEHRATLIAAG